MDEKIGNFIEQFNSEEKALSIIKQFNSDKHLLKGFENRITSLITELLIDKGLNIHNISSRVKDEESLAKKIKEKINKYNCLNDITDLVGIRIITHFEDYVDKVAGLIEEEFIIDSSNSVDKRKKDYDRFGYQSLHYIISLSDERTKLSENKKYKGLKAEIQIRSVLQHAWAEMEHDIGYKNTEEIPEIGKRSFSRIAALLETADIEFIRLRDGLYNHKTKLIAKIESEPEKVEIDFESLEEFIKNSSLLKEIDTDIAHALNTELEKDFNIPFEHFIEILAYLNFKNIRDLEEQLFKNKSLIIAFARESFTSNKPNILKGTCIFFLCNIIVASKQSLEEMEEHLMRAGATKDVDVEIIAKNILDTYNKLINS